MRLQVPALWCNGSVTACSAGTGPGGLAALFLIQLPGDVSEESGGRGPTLCPCTRVGDLKEAAAFQAAPAFCA